MAEGWRGLALSLAVLIVACESGDAPDTAVESEQTFLERTAEEHAADTTEPTPVATTGTTQAVVGRTLAYGEQRDRNLMGYLAMPEDAAEPLPGLNDNIRAATDRLAAEGFIALAIDLYDGRVAENPAQAETYMGQLMAAQDDARDNIRQAHEYLRKYALSPKVGAIGWCLGGGWSLQSALVLSGQLDAAVMYYGRVSTDAEVLAALETPLLGLFAGQDRVVPVADVEAFRGALEQLGKDATIHIYPGADHAFANPTGGNYDQVAAKDAWGKTVDFLRAHLEPIS